MGYYQGEVKVFRVEITKAAKKDLLKCPHHVVKKLLDWVEDIEDRGLIEVRKIPGYHDEPLKGERMGQRSVRLSKSYRAFYVEKNGEFTVVSVLEVNKHGY